jgi:predicted ATPase/class 3 adenylate cyclase
MGEITSFGAWLRRRRKALDLTQADLAERAGCVPGTIKSIEADARRPSKQLAERLADVLELRPEERAAFLKAARAERSPDRLSSPTQLAEQAVGGTAAPPATDAHQRALPSGTVTFLFTDIEGSTQRWEQYPQAMQDALTRHDAILADAITAHQGMVVKSTGDGMHAVFARATDALAAVLAAQQALQLEDWGAIGPLRVRMVLHTGVAEQRERDYFGPTLNRAARLLAVGHGGQVLLSRATWELVADHLPADVELHNLGEQRLKDLSRPEHIFQLVAPDLPTDFPPLKTLDQRRTNLPAQPTALIGRVQEVASVCALLRRDGARLMTLTGPGGTGKTRLAVQVATELLDAFADGVWFVDLAPISDPELVIPTIFQTLGLKEQGAQTPVGQLKAYLRGKHLLLVLDNFEQVVDAARQVAELLTAAPQLKALITSRVVLRLRGEQEYAVPPLALPNTKQLPPLEALSQYAAVELFIQRARDVKLDFQVTNANAPAVAEICHRLDGLPLAIELAAARVKLFAPEALLVRLERRLGMLTGGSRDVPARQQTIRNTIEWSYQLLDAGEKRLFVRLGVFVGGCTIEAAQAVCNADGDLPMEILDGIAVLVDQSLVRQIEGSDSEPRFRMLETIREYALERLDASGEVEAYRQRHAAYYQALAEAAEPELVGRDQLRWSARLDAEQDNLRTTLAWALERHEVEAGLRLAVALRWLWIKRGLLSEGRRWLEMLLATSDQAQVPGSIRADAQAVAGELARWQEDAPGALPLLEAALHWYQSVGNQPGIADVLHALGWVIWLHGDVRRSVALFDESLARYRDLGDAHGIATVLLPRSYLTAHFDDHSERSVTMAEESLRLFREVGDLHGVATALRHVALRLQERGSFEQAADLADEALRLARALGVKPVIMDNLDAKASIAISLGDVGRARMLQEERLALAREIGHTRYVSGALLHLSTTARYQGNLVEAQTLLEEALRLAQEFSMPFYTAWLRQQQGNIAYDGGNVDRASHFYRESLAISCDLQSKRDYAEHIEGLAAVAGAQGKVLRAVRLWSSAAATREAIGAPLPPIDRPQRDAALARLRAQLDDTTFASAWAAGQVMSLEQAVAHALEG